MKKLNRSVRVLLLLVLCGSVYAVDNPSYGLVSLQNQAQEEIPNDLMQAWVVVEHENQRPDVLAKAVNKDMQWALSEVKKVKGIKLQTESYSTYPVYDKRRIRAWRASQQLKLRSTNFGKMSNLIGILQARLQVRNIHFSTQPETRKEVENRLIRKALKDFKNRVQIVADTMGSSAYQIVNLHVNTGNRYAQPIQPRIRMASAMDESHSAPAVAGGTSQIVVSVSGQVQLDK